MAINLLGLLKDQMTDGVLEKMAGLAGADKAATGSAMNAILPTIMGSVLKQSETTSGAGKILDLLKSGNHDGGMLDNLGSVLGGGSASSGLMDAGKGILSMLMGSRQSGVLDLLGKATGLSRGSNTSLMSMAAPMVMGLVGKYVKNKALDAVGLGKFLGGQRNSVMSALPAGMDQILGFANTSGSTSSTSKSTASTSTKTVSEPENKGGGGWIKWLLMGLIGLGLISFLASRGCAGGDAVNAVKDGASGVVNTTTGAVKSGANAVGNAAGAATDAAGNAVAGAKDAAGNVVAGAKDAAGNMAAGAKDAAGNMVAGAKDAAGNVVGAAKDAAGNAATAVSGAGAFTLNAGGDLLDSNGKVISKAGEFTKSKDGYYVDKAGNKIGKWLAGAKDKVVGAANKAGDAVAGAAGKTADAMKNTFEKMFKKESGAASAYNLSQIKWNPENHKIENFSKAEVEGLAAALKANPSSKIKVQVHTSEGKNAIQNKAIAAARADVVEKMLIALGVGKGQISSKGVTKDAAKSAKNVVEILVD